MRFRHAAVIALFVPTGAWAGFINGNELKDICAANDVAGCVAYIMGALDAAMTLTAWGANTTAPICLPTEATGGQVKAIVEKYITERPEELHLSGTSIVLNAVGLAFPCKQ
jgi:hypothetical protein